MKFRDCAGCVVVVVFLFSATAAGLAAAATKKDAAPGASQDQEPIRIEADKMESYEKKGTVRFSGNVIASQGETTIHSQVMDVFYAKSEGKEKDVKDSKGAEAVPSSQKMEKLYATGNVKITKGETVGTSREMEYFSKDSKVILKGGARAWQNKNLVEGEQIILYLDEGRSIVERGQKKGERVKAFIAPSSKK